MRGRRHSDETRAQVVAALLAGQGVSEVAEAYSIDKSVVSRWRAAIPHAELQQIATKKRDEIGELLTGYLREAITTLRVQAEFARDTTWLKTQPASEVAVLHGVISDKTVRLLEAAELGEADEATGERG